MIKDLLLISGIVIIIFGYVRFSIMYLIKRKHKIKTNSLECALDLFKDDNSIKIIESNDSYFSKYNIKRDIVKLTSNSYDKNDAFSVATTYFLSLYASSDNKYLELLGKIISNIKVISFTPIVVIFTSVICNTSMDSKIGILILLLLGAYQYIIDSINMEIVDKKLKDNKEVNKLVLFFKQTNRLFFITTLIELVRLIMILLNI